MSFFEMVIFSTALSVDAFGIGVSCELRNIKTPVRARIIICIMSMLVTGLAIFLGSAISSFVPLCFGEIIGAVMLLILGVYVVFGALSNKEIKTKKVLRSKKDNILNLAVKPLGITIRIIRNPIECDMDNSSSVDIAEACYIGLAISLDSFAAGLGAGVGGLSGMVVPFMCGVCQMIFLCAGVSTGKKLHNIKCIKQKYFSVISGIMLIVIAVLRVIFTNCK